MPRREIFFGILCYHTGYRRMNDEDYMKLALELAAKAKGRTSPNPMVGAVVVKDGKIVSQGYHRKAGQPHAEVDALNKAGNEAKGATLYLNLEPCVHYGRTPPCTRRIIESGTNRVVVAIEDPNPLNSGRGAKELRETGIEVEVGLLADQAAKLNEVYIKYITTKRPFVILKSAMSLDGRIATRTGDSKWITSEWSRAYVHQLRGEVDAILVGIETILRDNPRLTVRIQDPRSRILVKNPVRIIVDSRARVPSDAKVLNGEAPTLVAVTKYAPAEKLNKLKRRDAGVLIVDDKTRKVNLDKLMGELGRLEITSVLIEGGGQINASALADGIVDKVLFFIAPKIIGGTRAPGPVAGEGPAKLSQAISLRDISLRRFGDDILVEGYVLSK
jgi:diaminohydroxyphosphoribosylaminopyrimidine deaminase/5-amino-6-(5-phosphoribosylamino)uracil reductase